MVGRALGAVSNHIGTNAPTALGRMAPKLLIGAAAIGAGVLLTGCMSDAERAERELKREEARTGSGGTPISELVDGFVERHDHDEDGAIELGSPTGFPEDDERLWSESRTVRKTDRNGNPFSDDWGRVEGTEKRTQMRYFSRAAQLTQMDADGDRRVSRDELTAWIEEFDATESGNLNEVERDAYDAAIKPITSEWRTVDSSYRSHGSVIDDWFFGR